MIILQKVNLNIGMIMKKFIIPENLLQHVMLYILESTSSFQVKQVHSLLETLKNLSVMEEKTPPISEPIEQVKST